MIKSYSFEASSANEFQVHLATTGFQRFSFMVRHHCFFFLLVAPSIELRGAGALKSECKRTDPPPVNPCRRSEATLVNPFPGSLFFLLFLERALRGLQSPPEDAIACAGTIQVTGVNVSNFAHFSFFAFGTC
jgi:hypothetical protein